MSEAGYIVLCGEMSLESMLVSEAFTAHGALELVDPTMTLLMNHPVTTVQELVMTDRTSVLGLKTITNNSFNAVCWREPGNYFIGNKESRISGTT